MSITVRRPRPNRPAMLVILVALIAWGALIVRATEAPWSDDLAIVNSSDGDVILRLLDAVDQVTAWYAIPPHPPGTMSTVRLFHGGTLEHVDVTTCRVLHRWDPRGTSNGPVHLSFQADGEMVEVHDEGAVLDTSIPGTAFVPPLGCQEPAPLDRRGSS